MRKCTNSRRAIIRSRIIRWDRIDDLEMHRFRPLWLRSSVVSVLLSVTAGTTTNVVSIVTLIFGTGE